MRRIRGREDEVKLEWKKQMKRGREREDEKKDG